MNLLRELLALRHFGELWDRSDLLASGMDRLDVLKLEPVATHAAGGFSLPQPPPGEVMGVLIAQTSHQSTLIGSIHYVGVSLGGHCLTDCALLQPGIIITSLYELKLSPLLTSTVLTLLG